MKPGAGLGPTLYAGVQVTTFLLALSAFLLAYIVAALVGLGGRTR